MVGPSVDSIKWWANWHTGQVPKFTVYQYSHYVPPHKIFVFKQHKGPRVLTYNIESIRLGIVTGIFRPFVIVTEQAKNYV